MRNIVDIFRDVVEGLSQEIPVNSVSVSGGVYTLNVSRTYWSRPSSQNSLATKVTVGVATYDIQAVNYNESILIETDDDLSEVESVVIAAPVYINGTQISTQKRRRNKNSWVQCPFVWLVEPFVSNEQKDELSIIDAVPDVTMLFLDNSKPEDWTTAEKYDKVILAMKELTEAFYRKLKSTRATFGNITNWRVVNWADFGQEGKQGAIQSILNEHTAGIELRFSVEIYKSLSTCNT